MYSCEKSCDLFCMYLFYPKASRLEHTVTQGFLKSLYVKILV